MARDPSNLAVTVIGVAVLLVIGSVAWFGLGAETSAPPAPRTVELSVGGDSIQVHVSGSVVSPGVVQLSGGSIVADAIRAAGGALRAADLASINLAAPVRPGERINVPELGEREHGVALEAESGIDLNSATSAQLEDLPGVGPVLASRIVAFRTERGPFLIVEDLLDVPGIGEAKLAQMRDAISRP